VAVHRNAVAATLPTSTARSARLNNLVGALVDLYAATGERGLLEEAVGAQREAVAATPTTSTDRPRYLSNLAGRLAGLYVVTGERGLLEEAVGVQREAVAATPATSTGRPPRLNNLALHLSSLYAVTGDRGLLEEAVGAQREAVAATPATSTERPTYLNNLAGRLSSLYEATGDRDVLEEAVVVQREAVAATPATSTNRPAWLSNLATHLSALYEATGDHDLLEEAVRLQREAVAATPATSSGRPARLSNLARRLSSLYEVTGDRDLLDEAVGVQREAVAATPATSTDRPAWLSNLANRLADLYGVTGDRDLLDEAVRLQREAVAATPATSTSRPAWLGTLAGLLSSLYKATGDRDLLDEAVGVVEGVRGGGPEERLRLSRTRARLARQTDDLVAAAVELEAAHRAFDEEIARLRAANNPVRLRDLAQRVDGQLGDLAATHIANGNIHRALELLESDRVWLRAPGQDAARQVPHSKVAVAWVVPSLWETAVVTAADATSPPDSFERHTVAVTHNELGSAAADTINAARNRDPEASDQAVARLIDLTSRVVATFPQAPRLLVVPLGIAALLPYAAAPCPPAGAPLVERTAVTLAPSLAWALAAYRARPAGRGHVGVFHPGSPPLPVLSLEADRYQFETLVGPDVLDQPTAQEVLAALESGVDIGHFSCHGTYDHLRPLDSHLLLATELHLRAVLSHRHAPWLTNLSACETGVPDLQALEQLVSFPTGFLLGGAAHVFATLWPVGNIAATTINGHAYQHLANGAHPAEALRQAVQHLRHQSTPPATAAMPHARTGSVVRSLMEDDDQRPQTSGLNTRDETHPYWWAPFVHYGSPW
jgi:CHAT domain-containing protein